MSNIRRDFKRSVKTGICESFACSSFMKTFRDDGLQVSNRLLHLTRFYKSALTYPEGSDFYTQGFKELKLSIQGTINRFIQSHPQAVNYITRVYKVPPSVTDSSTSEQVLAYHIDKLVHYYEMDEKLVIADSQKDAHGSFQTVFAKNTKIDWDKIIHDVEMEVKDKILSS